jgi:hypothetical protein
MRGEAADQRDHRQQQMAKPFPDALAQRRVTGRGQPAEIAREQHDNDNRPEELRHRDEEILPERQHTVAHPADMSGRMHAEPEPDHSHEDDRDAGEEGRPADRVDQVRGDRPLHHERLAEVAAENAGKPAPVLDEDRIIEAKRILQRADLVHRGELAEDHVGDVAGQDLRDREDQHRHHPKDDHQVDQPLERVEEHDSTSPHTLAVPRQGGRE